MSMFHSRTSELRTWRWMLAGVVLMLGLGDSAMAGAFTITGQPTVTILPGLGNPLGTFEVAGNLAITLTQDLGTTAVFNVDAYALSIDFDANGTFFEANDEIIETTPFTNILAVDPIAAGVLLQFPGPITLTTDATNGTWNLTGRVGEYLPGIGTGGDGSAVPPTLASGTFSGSLLDPTELLMTLGYRGSQQQLGPFNAEEPFAPITFTAVPEPATLSLLIFGGLALLRHRGRVHRRGR